jgi:glutamine synthetase
MTAGLSDSDKQGIGRSGFVAQHGLHSPQQQEAAARMVARIRELELRTVRIIIVDQHGIPRTKFLSSESAIAGLRNGVDFSGAIYSLDTGNVVFPPAFAEGGGFGIPEFTGFPDVVVVPDPTTFQVLPWADRTGWVLCDAYFSNGKPIPLDGRRILRTQLERLGAAGYRYLAGLEVEFYIVRRESSTIGLHQTGAPPPPPSVDVFEQGYQFLSEVRLDGVNDTLTALRDALYAVGLPPRSMEDEWGPGQMEFTFSPLEGLASADAMVLFRSTVKQICQRRGLLATFMCRPALPNFFASGWHLHESLLDAAGTNVFASATETLSPVGRHYVAGLLQHAQAMTLFTTPTVNGFSRFQPYSFAPDRVCWAVENRGAMVRVQGGPGDPGTHLENRLGEPAANPYLYLAADIAAGLDGITRRLSPPLPVEDDPYAADAAPLPATFEAGIEAMAADPLYREQFGDSFLDYYLMMKRAELVRYTTDIKHNPPAEGMRTSPWEMREYFEIF